MFQPVNNKASFPELEERILRFWKEKEIFRKTLEARKEGPRFVFYEGPPTANGKPGIHHVLSRVYKDIILRYQTMKGHYVPRKAGWDTHGLPVELEVEKKLGFSGKRQIEEFGVAKFNELCRESVFSYLKDWDRLTERIGFWLDQEHPYITMDNSYVESCWWAIKQLWDKGLIYQGYRVTPHCPRCGTSLSSHEVALGYKDDTSDPSVFIKFRVDFEHGQPSASARSRLTTTVPTYLLAWTTTPWTLPGNTALAVAPGATYLVVEVAGENGPERLIVADARLEQAVNTENKVVGAITGSELLGLAYSPLFPPGDFGVQVRKFGADPHNPQVLTTVYEPAKAGNHASGEPPTWYTVIGGDFVSMEDGTGIVHVAPAFGEIDYEIGQKEGLFFVQQVDLAGNLTGNYPFSGLFIKRADPKVMDDLKRRGLSWRQERIKHTYPFCWRCDTPLVYYAKQSWYIRTTALKDQLVAGNSAINWYPEYIKLGRFGDWLKNNVDWAFSRERYWGTPLPIWQCPDCGSSECTGSKDDIRRLADTTSMSAREIRLEDCLKDLHRPMLDQVLLKCPKCGKTMTRRQEVVDCWFDSGAMPFAQWHYPFENKALFEQTAQADFISEAVDQTRGWFYSLHALSTLLHGHPAFKNVICLGHILDAEGEKMSKTRGNVVDPWSVLDTTGCDALRWYLYTSAPAGNVRRFSTPMVQETLRNFILTLWNTYSFFVMYANTDNWDPATAKPGQLDELDRWILSELHQLIDGVDGDLAAYDPTSAARRLEGFVDGLSNWYVRRSRRRFWKSESDSDKAAAYATLHQCLVTVARLCAPFMPFISEEIYQNLVRGPFPDAPESVHMADFPVADLSNVDDRLAADTRLAIKVCSLGRAARAKAQVKVRQPLPKVMVKVKNEEEKSALVRLSAQILEELNVKECEPTLSSELPSGPGYHETSEADCRVVVCAELSASLQAEGSARELVRHIQTMRKRANFEITDRILVWYQGDLDAVLKDWGDYIRQEVLADDLVCGPPENAEAEQTQKIGGQPVTLAIRRAR
jgi:isoleucyl-tRNA synthetase